MTSTRAKRLRALLAGLSVVVAGGHAPSAWAQGFGPDPFRPYNSQYDPYLYPIGPATPDGGQLAAARARGLGGANQFQEWLDELQGITRSENERYGIGMPYYRRAVDPAFDREGKREYRPNRQSERAFENTQQLITEKYLAYFAERDPNKRVQLIRDYNRTRRNVTRALSATRSANASALLDAAAGLGGARGSGASAAGPGTDLRAGRNSTRRSSDRDRSDFPPPFRRRGGGASGVPRSEVISPPPPVPRPGRARRAANPDDVLERANRTEDRSPRASRPEINRRTTPAEPPATSPDE
jgi:hypothetical protein